MQLLKPADQTPVSTEPIQCNAYGAEGMPDTKIEHSDTWPAELPGLCEKPPD